MLNTSRRHSASCQPSTLSRAGGARPQFPDSWASRCSGHPACSWPKGTECGLRPHGRAPQKKHQLFPDRFNAHCRHGDTSFRCQCKSGGLPADRVVFVVSARKLGKARFPSLSRTEAFGRASPREERGANSSRRSSSVSLSSTTCSAAERSLEVRSPAVCVWRQVPTARMVRLHVRQSEALPAASSSTINR
jgi:hypothetical protein